MGIVENIKCVIYNLEKNKKALEGNKQSLEDLSKETLILREKGSGTRVLLDEKLRLLKINSDNINGYLINENNLEEMSKKINILINDIDTRLRFKQNAKYDIDKFDLDKIINKWINVLSNL